MRNTFISSQKLNREEMKQISGGQLVPKEEYCKSIELLFNSDNQQNMSHGACEGAREGARRAGCNLLIYCGE